MMRIRIMQDHSTGGGPIEIKGTVGAMLTGGPPPDSLHRAGLLNIHSNTRSVTAKRPSQRVDRIQFGRQGEQPIATTRASGFVVSGHRSDADEIQPDKA